MHEHRSADMTHDVVVVPTKITWAAANLSTGQLDKKQVVQIITYTAVAENISVLVLFVTTPRAPAKMAVNTATITSRKTTLGKQ